MAQTFLVFLSWSFFSFLLDTECCCGVQAEQQLGPGWTLMRAGTPKCPEIQDWLATSLPEGARVGIDPFLHTVSLSKSSALVPLQANDCSTRSRSSHKNASTLIGPLCPLALPLLLPCGALM